jgi:hypothetical protein
VTVYLLCCNSVPFGHYADDIKWALLAETFLRGSVQTAWSVVPLPDTTITWGFGFLLMPVVALFGRQPLVLKIFSALCVVGGSGLFYFSVRRMLDASGRVLVLAGLGGVAFMATFSGNVISEAGYLLLFGLFAYLVTRFEGNGPRNFFIMGVVAGALYLVRNIGALAPLSLVAFKRRFLWNRVSLVFAVGFLLVAVPVSVMIFRLSGTWSFYGSYWLLGSEGSLLAGTERFMGNLLYYWKGLTCMTLLNIPAVLPPISWVKGGCMSVGAFFVGRGLWLWREPTAGRWLGLYFLGYMIVLGLWTYQAPRYALPIFPVFLAFMGAGVRGAWERAWGRVVLVGVLCGIFLTNGSEITGLVRKSMTQEPDLPHESEQWLRTHSRPDEIVVSMDIARVFYFTGRRGVPFIPSTDAASFESGARRLGATVFFFRDNDYVSAASGVTDPIVRQHETLRAYLFGSNSFAPVYTNVKERTTIFRFRGSAPVV